MAFTKRRHPANSREYRLACGHKQYGPAGEPWEGVKCLTCEQTTKVITQEGPKSLSDLLRLI